MGLNREATRFADMERDEMRKSPFDIVFPMQVQPGWQSRLGADPSRVVAAGSIGPKPKSKNPEPFSADQVFDLKGNLPEQFVSMQVPALLPSRIYRRKFGVVK